MTTLMNTRVIHWPQPLKALATVDDPPLGQHVQAELYGHPRKPHMHTEGNNAFEPTVLVDTRIRIIDATLTRGRLRVAFRRYHSFRWFGNLESK